MPERISVRRLQAVLEPGSPGEVEPVGSLRRALADCPTARPEWCFAAETNGRTLAAAGFRGPRGRPLPDRGAPPDLYLLGLWAAWGEPGVDRVCAELFRRALPSLHEEGAKMLTAYVYLSGSGADRRAAILDALRLPLFQERAHFVYDPARPVPEAMPGVTYRSLSAVGREPFVAAIRKIHRDTLDRGIQQNVRLLGERRAAEQTFDEIADRDGNESYQANLWRLGYDASGQLVGLVMPILFWEGRAAIGFIGVVPEQRGKGYANDLLAEGTRLLAQAGQREIVADIDRRNLPMAAALARVGYVTQGGERIYDAAIGDWLKTVGKT
jgi:RimJ/RimL family protein N-acetyltransferase